MVLRSGFVRLGALGNVRVIGGQAWVILDC